MTNKGIAPELEDSSSGNTDWIILGGLTLLALLSRLWGIGEWGVISDEYYTITYAAERAKSFLQPAYYALVLGSHELFGETPWAARFPSAILGTLAIPVFYLTFRHLIGSRTALFGCAIIIMSEWHLYHSQLSRFYSGVFLFGITSYYYYYQSLRKDDVKLFFISLISMLLGILFHATAILVPVSCGFFALLVLFRKDGVYAAYSKRIARINVFSFIALALALIPLVLFIVNQWGVGGGTEGKGLFENASLSEPLGIIVQFLLQVEVIFAFVALVGVLLAILRKNPIGLFFFYAIAVQFLSILILAILLPPVRDKYIISIYPLLIAAAAYLCLECASLLRPKLNYFSQVVSVVLLLSMLPAFISYYTGKMSLDIKDPVRYLESSYTEGDQVIAFSHALNYHLNSWVEEENLQVYGGRGVWRSVLREYPSTSHDAWVIVDLYRSQSFETGIYKWLNENARLVWRKNETRFDYSMLGWEVYLIERKEEEYLSPPTTGDN